MLNHARTLLMNVNGTGIFPDTPGEELVPSDYRAVTLPSSLQSVRRLLFGSTPDRHMLNYRVRQLLTLIHSCELAEFVTDLDSRLTYNLRDTPYFDQTLFQPKAHNLTVSSGATTDIYLFGSADAPDRSGRMHNVWDVELLSAAAADIRLRGTMSASEQAYSIASGLSTHIPLVGSALTFQIRQSSFVDGSGPKFRIESVAKPTVELGSLLASIESLGAETLADLFARAVIDGSREPMLTFRRLYEDHYDLPHRLGGVVLALIYRTEARR